MFTPKLGGGRGQLWKSLFPGPEVMDKTWSSQSGGKGTWDRGNNGAKHKSENRDPEKESMGHIRQSLECQAEDWELDLWESVDPRCVPELGTAIIRGEIRNNQAPTCKGNSFSSHLPDLSCFHHLPLTPIFCPLVPLFLSQDISLADQGQWILDKKDKAKVVWDSHLPLSNSWTWNSRLWSVKNSQQEKLIWGSWKYGLFEDYRICWKNWNGEFIVDGHDPQDYYVI